MRVGLRRSRTTTAAVLLLVVMLVQTALWCVSGTPVVQAAVATVPGDSSHYDDGGSAHTPTAPSSLQEWAQSRFVQERAVPFSPCRHGCSGAAHRLATPSTTRSDVHRHAVPLSGPAPPLPSIINGGVSASGRYVVLTRAGRHDRERLSLTTSSTEPSRREAAMLSQLEEQGLVSAEDVHFIDGDMALVYLRDGQTTSAAVVEGVTAEGVPEETETRLLDVFATATGQLLKLSAPLRKLVQADGEGNHTWRGASDALFQVSVWAATNMEEALARDFLQSPRLRELRSAGTDVRASGSGGGGGGECRVTLTPQRASGTSFLFMTLGSRERRRAGSGDNGSTPAPLPSSCLAVLRLLVAHPAVRWVEEVPRRAEPLNMHASSIVQCGHGSGVGAGGGTVLRHPLWDMQLDGSGEVVAVADSGLDVHSCFFADDAQQTVAIYPELNPHHRKILSFYSCEGPGVRPVKYDLENGHGTHVAGSIAGATDGKQLSAYSGVAPGAKLFVRALGCDGSTALTLPTSISEIFGPSYKAGARIASNSWGIVSGTDYSAVEKLVDRFAFENDDMLILFAAGNSPSDGLYSPGMSKNVLTVGAHANSLAPASQDTVHDQSAYGPTYDGRRKPDVVGPGSPYVQSAAAGGNVTKQHCRVVKKFGTSMATAVVAGGAALLRQHLRRDLDIVMPSAALLKGLLAHSSMLLTSPIRSGFGRVDLSLFVAPPDDSGNHSRAETTREGQLRLSSWVRDRVMIEDRATHQYCFTAMTPSEITRRRTNSTKTEEMLLKVTLSWTDIAVALEGSKKSLVHDLDLVVVDADGVLHYVGLANPTTPFLDRRNNVEQVRVPMTPGLARALRVFVHAHSVRAAEVQAYALVVSAPGLEYMGHCEELFQQLADRHAEREEAVAVECPNKCSAHGTCDPVTKQCLCHSGYMFVDCSQCDDEVMCNRQGTCNAATMTCECNRHSHFLHTNCSGCVDGWYGPRCDSKCECEHGGSCNTATGLCRCPADPTIGGLGCFQGSQCEYCCDNFGGPDCNERSYWCDESGAVVLVDDKAGGYIQVNGYPTYPFSVTCRWRITAAVGYRVRLAYLRYDIEAPYDNLYLYDFSSNATTTHVRQDNGVLEAPFEVRSLGRELELVFVSDWAATRSGFLLHYQFEVTFACKVECGTQSDAEGINDGVTVSPRRQAVVCGDAVALDTWCMCSAAYMGWHCERSTVDDTRAGEASSRRPSPFAAESLLYVDASEALVPAGGETDGDVIVHPHGIARLPVAINAFSLLSVQMRLPQSRGTLSSASLELSLLPDPEKLWLGSVLGVTITLMEVYTIGESLAASRLGAPQQVSLFYCGDDSAVSLNITLWPPGKPNNLTTGVSVPEMSAPSASPATNGQNGGTDAAVRGPLLTAQFLVGFLWNTSQPLAEGTQEGDIHADVAAVSRLLRLSASPRLESAQRSSLVARCAPTESPVTTGAALLPETVPTVSRTRHVYVSTMECILVLLVSAAGGIILGLVMRRFEARVPAAIGDGQRTLLVGDLLVVAEDERGVASGWGNVISRRHRSLKADEDDVEAMELVQPSSPRQARRVGRPMRAPNPGSQQQQQQVWDYVLKRGR